MKEFEKQWASRYMNQGGYGMKWLAKKFWRAALKWFYTKLDHSQEHEELKDLIEQELEEEK